MKHGENSSGELGPGSLLGDALHSARCLPNSAQRRLLSQLTAGNQVSGITAKCAAQVRMQSDESAVTRFRRDDRGSSLHPRGKKMVTWSVAGGEIGFSQVCSLNANVHGPKVQMRMGRCEACLRRNSITDARVEPVKGV
jgi:hypothetical protein